MKVCSSHELLRLSLAAGLDMQQNDYLFTFMDICTISLTDNDFVKHVYSEGASALKVLLEHEHGGAFGGCGD